jgi:hypothetical protein
MSTLTDATPERVHIGTVEALAATVPPRAYGRYPKWVKNPETEAQFVASLVVHVRDGEVPEKFAGKPFAPMCDADGYVTALPLRIKAKQ